MKSGYVSRVLLVATTILLMMGTVSAEIFSDGFEDQDLTEYSGDTADFSIVSDDPLNGSYHLSKTSNIGTYSLMTAGSYQEDGAYTWEFWARDNGVRGFVSIYFAGDGSGNHYQTAVTFDDNTNNDRDTVQLYNRGGSFDSGATTKFTGLGLASDEWVRIKTVHNTSSGEITVEAYSESGNQLGSLSVSDDTYSTGEWGIKQYEEGYMDSLLFSPPNELPSFNSVESDPMSWTLNSLINVSANVSDEDGTVSGVSADVWENGSQIVSDASLSDSDGDGTWEISNLFTVDESDVYYNLTLTATDDDGATDTYETSQLIKNLNPKIAHLSPGNNSDVFTYTPEYRIRIRDDGDNVPGENITCDLYSNSEYFRTVSALENESQSERTFTGQLSEDVGSNEFKTSCVDGTRTNTTTSYETRYSRVEDVYSPSEVFETENRSFDSTLRIGDMVNSVDSVLSYDGEIVEQKDLNPVDGGGSFQDLAVDFQHEIPLVDSNQTEKNWRIEYNLNISDYENQTTSTVQDQTQNQNQTIQWSYWLENSDTDPKNGNYIEGGDLKHNVTLGKTSEKADLSGITEYSRNGETEEMQVIQNESDSSTFQGVIGVGTAEDFNKSTFQTNSTIEIQFNGETRDISTSQDDVNVHRIRLTPDSSETNTAKALVFHTEYEGTENQDIETDLLMDLTLSKNGVDRSYSYVSEEKSSHEFYIRPSWAEYDIRTDSEDLIQYEKSDGTGVLRSYFFPQRETISNETTTVPLLNINKTETQTIDFEVTRSSGAPAAGVICRVDRKFPGLGKYQTVFMIKTGSEGNTESFAEVNEIYYRFTCYEDGEVIDTIEDTIMQNPMRLKLGVEDRETFLNYNENFDASCTNNQTQIECDYQSQTDNLDQAVLTVERKETVRNQEVCTQTGTSRTGTLICDGLNTTAETYDYTVKGQYSGGQAIGATGTIGVNTTANYGPIGILMTILIYPFIYIAAAKHMMIGIGVGTSWFLVSSMLGFFPLTPEIRATLIGIVLVIGAVKSA